jgi:RNA polymerase sigma-70 factor (ECF subfamily)
MDTSASLLERLRRPDDRAAWTRFVALYTPLLYFWARRKRLQEADAADLVQEVMVQLFRKLPEFRYDPQRSFRSWLRTVTLNTWRERLRRRGPEINVGDAALADAVQAENDEAITDAEYRAHLVQQTLRALQNEFPKTTWQAFQEYGLRGRPVREVAQELGLSVGTVYAAKSLVLTRVRRELDGLLD